ncbi:MAG: shikimate dehydrogenase [Gammaproteobacteria bacterium]
MAGGEVTDRFAVLGQPVAHSLSPQIHEGFAQQLGLSLSYEKIDVEPAAFAGALARLHRDGYRGMNVTLPHKLAALSAATEVAERARLAGAANTLTRTDSGWRADNTDGEGLMRDLRDNHWLNPSGLRVLLLGAGGAARGALKPLLDAQPALLVISGRTPWKVEKLAEEFKAHGPLRPSTHVALKGDSFDLVINATSAGHDGLMPRLPDGVLKEGGACYDLSYGKAFEPFRNWALSHGARVVADGLGMLVEQAAASFELWHGRRPPTAPMISALRVLRGAA